MRLYTPLDRWTTKLLGSLALLPAVLSGCGGSVAEPLEAGKSFSCEHAQAYPDGVPGTGYERCDGGFLHRGSVESCPSTLPRAIQCEQSPDFDECHSDADCKAKPYGSCNSPEFDTPGCACRYGCVGDSDCAPGQICLCGEPAGTCVAATCASDADCSGDLMCTSYVTEPGCGGTAFACQTTRDGCGGDGDCKQNQQCSLSDTGRHVCEDIECAIGRPFLVHGEARTAPPATRGDWTASRWSASDLSRAAPEVAGLAPALRAELAAGWTEVGLLEHASVAAFARFALQLLSLGAPPGLVTAATEAMADETRHALAAFGLASAYAGAPVGPGPLALEGALEASDAEAVLRTAIREGCAGEAVAAGEASEAAARATDPAVHAVLARVADDEARHAELAFRFVKWLVGERPALRPVLADELGRLESEARTRAAAPTEEDEALLGHGVARPSVRHRLRTAVLARVTIPVLGAMLGERHDAGVFAQVGLV